MILKDFTNIAGFCVSLVCQLALLMCLIPTTIGGGSPDSGA
jgi:high-affinity K+ transport system ATPase subunit B